MKSVEAYPALGSEYDDEEVSMPSKRTVYSAIGAALIIVSAVLYEAGYRAFELISPYF